MNQIHYRGQKFKKRLSKEELKSIANDCFQKIGMDKYVQSHILVELFDYVKKSKNPKFFSLIATPKCRKSIAWVQAYSLILKYLEEFRMTSTINAMNKESESLQISYDFNFLNQNLPSQYLKDAIKIQQRNRKKFTVRVSLFKIPPPIIIDENINSKENNISKTQINKSKIINTNLQNDYGNEEVSYISGEENSHFNVSSIDVLADDSFVDNE